MRLVIQDALIKGDAEAYRHLMDVLAQRDVEIVLNGCELLTVPAEAPEPDSGESEF